ncbi:serine hydrolase domain-containing protein [Nocardia carnea]|uniref:serine hydrolase domain-containing protein n=1 Tax=Nocardia carnea TaxID=37328 RepID=UPI0024542135|nr:serine hydrolase domain-containing protein [Nocardia carnea]
MSTDADAVTSAPPPRETAAADRISPEAGRTPAPGTGPLKAARIQPAALQSALDSVQRAGIPGIHAEVRWGAQLWRGAAGVADLASGSPVRPEMRQRIGSITKTFTAAAVVQQAEQGRIRLDAPIGDYLSHLVPLDTAGIAQPHPIDAALEALHRQAACGA